MLEFIHRSDCATGRVGWSIRPSGPPQTSCQSVFA
jgi:hypothetical protein